MWRFKGGGGKSKLLSVTRHAPPPWLISCPSGSMVGRSVADVRVVGSNPARGIFFVFRSLFPFALSLAVNWTSANAGFAQCRASACVSLSPVALPPWGGNVHERSTRRVHRKKGVRYRIDLWVSSGIQFAWARLKLARRAPSRLRCCTLPSLYAREHRITTRSQWFSCRTVSLYSLILQFAGVRLSFWEECPKWLTFKRKKQLKKWSSSWSSKIFEVQLGKQRVHLSFFFWGGREGI